MTTRSLLVLHDQLSRRHGALASASPTDTRILVAEPRWWFTAPGTHAQKIVTYVSAVRHLANELRNDGFEVDHVKHDDDRCTDLGRVVSTHLDTFRPTVLEATTQRASSDARSIREAADRHGVHVTWHDDPMWISTNAAYDAWARGRTALRMEMFYRTVRQATGWLMDGDQPLGGRWNYDADNRRPPNRHVEPPPAPRTVPDATTLDVLAETASAFPHAWGRWEPPSWPVTHADARAWLDGFVTTRLPSFGTYQDAMRMDHPWMWHSGLSFALNVGLLHPREVVEAALRRFHDGRGDVPLNAVEGFVRQVAGWREFIWHVHRTEGEALVNANALEANAPLPPAFWGAPTDLACLGGAVSDLHERGYVHHIQRLMVLGNVAQLVGVHPRTILDWFTATHVDALEWVMVPNVMGMSQYADGGRMTSKPYAAGANYLNRMSDACERCRFDPKGGARSDGCPLTPWYWSFVDRHHERLRRNPRTGVIASAWSKRAAVEKAALLEKAEQDRAALLEGRL